MRKIINSFVGIVTALMPVFAMAEAPKGYYATCEGLNGSQLLRQLESVIGDHKQVGYNGLWTLYKTSDVYPDGTIWDMYSTKHWKYSTEQCGTYSAVGDCYNREHSMPKSWFADALPMYCDAFHIYPTDGKVNGQRSNYPYGECAHGTTLSASGSVKALGKLGASTFPGYSGTVFEPDDEYKGDFARSYFYMAACYNSKIKNWDSDMLAGNSYPAFTSWAVELLLKWHRQDPVSQKEIDRNEVVYANQENRNPFIDYPEMAEYVWGDKKDGNWSASGEQSSSIALPVDGSVCDFGYLTVNKEKSLTITVKGINLTSPVVLSADDLSLTADKGSVSAAEANKPDGVKVVITWCPEEEGEMECPLRFTSGNLTSTVIVKGIAVAGLSANAAKNVSDRSFVASWNYVGDTFDDGTYQVCYKPNDDSEYFETESVPAVNCECLIEGLQPNTEYVYMVRSKTMESNRVVFTTGDPIPYIQLLYDGNLFLEAQPGEPSQAYELLVDAENIEGDIKVEVREPFAISTDKSNWDTTLVLNEEEDRFYMRLYSEATGTFSTVIKLTAGSYVNDDIIVYGQVSESKGFLEDFEADATGCDTYNGCQYQGSAATWQLDNAGIWAADKTDALSGEQCVRMGKKADSAITMLGNKTRGIGNVIVRAKRWTDREGDCTFHVEYSTDNGENWAPTTDAIVNSNEYQEYVFAVNISADARIRVVQTAGARFIIDDVEMTDYMAGIIDENADYHNWDAYCLDGELVIESACPRRAVVFGADGIVRYRGEVAGRASFALASGLYVVAIDDFSRRVFVK